MAILLLVLLAPPVQDDFKLLQGDPATLRCRVKRITAVAKGVRSCIVEIDVRGGRAEPLSFSLRIRGEDKPLVVRRVEWPWFGRGGRTTPGAYPVLVPRTASELKGVRVSVEAASFFSGRPVEPRVKIGRLRTDRVAGPVDAPVPRTRVTVHNGSDGPIDAVFLVTCRSPVKGRSLVARRLAPGDNELEFTRFARYFGAELTRVKLVDWSVVRATGEKQASPRLNEALANWKRLPDDSPAVKGRFVYEVDGHRIEGKFAARGADVSIEATDQRPRAMIAKLFSFLRRTAPPEERLTYLEHGDWIGIHGDGVAIGDARYKRIAVRDGRIVGAQFQPGTGFSAWETQPAGDGYVVTGIRLDHAGTIHTQRFAYRALGGVQIPVSYLDVRAYKAMNKQRVERLDLVDVALSQSGPGSAPAGAGAAALKAAWEAGFRHPDPRPVRLVRIRVKAPAGHAEWQGVQKIVADARIAGDHVFVETLGDKLDGTTREVIASLVAGRLGMWSGVDFARRPDFETAFRDAHIEAGKDGTFRVRNGPYRFVTVKDGRVHALGLLDGRTRTLLWRKNVVEQVRQGHEAFTVHYKSPGVPRRIEIKNRFGPDWGTEVLEIEDRQ